MLSNTLRSMLAGGLCFVGLSTGAYITRTIWLPFVLPAQSATKEEAADPHAGHDHGPAGERVKLSPQAQANLKLDVEPLIPEEYWRKVQIPGVVVDRPGETDRGITARAAGLLVDIKARPGDTVKAGDVLFKIQLVSEFMQSTQIELAKAARELEFATTKRERTREFVRLGTKSSADLIEEDNQVRRYSTQVEAFRRQLLTFGLTPAQINQAEKGEVVTEVTINAPGKTKEQKPGESRAKVEDEVVYEVQELKAHLGEQVQPGQTLALLSNHQNLFVEGRAFKSEAVGLARAAKENWAIDAEFADETAGGWSPVEPLTIRHLANAVDPMTRTFAFYLPLKNESESYKKDGKTYLVWRFRPGQRVRLRVPVEKLGDEVFVLPAGAVVREGGEAYVFRQNGDLFERRPVKVLYEDRSDVVLANDGSVGPGEFIVRNQASALNRGLKAATGGGGDPHAGHDHPH